MIQVLMNIAKAQLLNKVLRRTLGGRLGTVMLVAYLGHKAYVMMSNKRQSRTA